MPLLLPSILTQSQRPNQPFLLLQSSTAQTCLPILRKIINSDKGVRLKRTSTLVLCFLYPPFTLVDESSLKSNGGHIEVLDYTEKIPGYDDSWIDPRDEILAAVQAGEHISSHADR